MADVLKEWVSEYQRLHVENASPAALDGAIELVERIAGVQIILPWVEEALAELDHQDSAKEELQKHLSESLQEYLQSSFEDAQLRRRRKRDLTQLQARAWKVAAAVSLPRFLASRSAEMSAARESLLADAGLVVFHNAYFALLPAIPAILQKERRLLFKAFLEFSADLADDSDRERVRALVYEALGEPILAADHYRRAVLATSPDRHEFMSLLQMAWSQAVEQDHFREALTILLESAPRVRAEDYAELKELVLETIEMRRAAA